MGVTECIYCWLCEANSPALIRTIAAEAALFSMLKLAQWFPRVYFSPKVLLNSRTLGGLHSGNTFLPFVGEEYSTKVKKTLILVEIKQIYQ